MTYVADTHSHTTQPTPPPEKSLLTADDDHLREILKRCPTSTYEAARQFRQSGDTRLISTIVFGVITRFVEPDLRSKLKDAPDSLRLVEDLAIDSLTMMEIVVLVEDVFSLSVKTEELRQLHTLGDIRHFIEAKLRDRR